MGFFTKWIWFSVFATYLDKSWTSGENTLDLIFGVCHLSRQVLDEWRKHTQAKSKSSRNKKRNQDYSIDSAIFSPPSPKSIQNIQYDFSYAPV